jgi:hemerythrin-like metal-binding protein
MTIAELIVWNDSLLTGVDEIDRQHRILVNTLNEVNSKLAEHPSEKLFEQITRDLLAYAIYHFETEEQLITRFGYDRADPAAAAAHVQQHRGFSQRVVALRDEVHSGQAVSPDALLTFLRDWLTEHICTTDQRLGRFICARLKDAAIAGG